MKEKGFNRGAYMAVITVITVCSVFLGSLIHLGGLLWRLPFGFGRPAGGGTISGTETIDSFTAAEIELDAGAFTIVKGSEYSLEFEGYPQGKEPQWKVKNGTLQLTQKMGSFGLGKNNIPTNCSVTITIPEGVQPDLHINMDMGGMELQNLVLGNVEADLDMGSFELTNCTTGNLSVDADMGSIELSGCTFTTGDMDADMGSIELKEVTFTSAECDADMGSIEVSGSFRALTAECSMGEITVTTAEGSEDAALDLKTDMGKVTVNGVSYGREYK